MIGLGSSLPCRLQCHARAHDMDDSYKKGILGMYRCSMGIIADPYEELHRARLANVPQDSPPYLIPEPLLHHNSLLAIPACLSPVLEIDDPERTWTIPSLSPSTPGLPTNCDKSLLYKSPIHVKRKSCTALPTPQKLLAMDVVVHPPLMLNTPQPTPCNLIPYTIRDPANWGYILFRRAG